MGRLMVICAGFLVACSAPEPSAVGKDGWLTGNTDQKLDTMAKHLRGNDLVMWEVGYRYQELLAGGMDENWPMAEYQLKKINLAMHMGAERRPGRQASYDWFFDIAIPPMQAAIASLDKTQFIEGFAAFTESCNTCHAMENVSFFEVKMP